MSEERAAYVTDTQPSRWIDIRFNDGKHTGVRVLAGTTVIEVRRDGRQTVLDIAQCMPIDLTAKSAYNG